MTAYRFPGTDPAGSMRRLEHYLHDAIPLVKHMQVRVTGLDERALTLHAPLAPNRNHIGTGFGGSLQGLATLSCWGLLWLLFEDRPTHIVVQECHMRFLKPACADFRAVCPAPEQALLQRCRDTMQARGRARLDLIADVYSDTRHVGHFTGRFVALRPE